MNKALGESFASFTESLLVLFEKCGFTLSVTSNTATTHDQVNFKDWINNNWKTILKSLKLILPVDIDESITQFILKTFQNMINLCGSLGMNQARDSFVLTLCQGCLPSGNIILFFRLIF